MACRQTVDPTTQITDLIILIIDLTIQTTDWRTTDQTTTITAQENPTTEEQEAATDRITEVTDLLEICHHISRETSVTPVTCSRENYLEMAQVRI